jgi:hypothetical protein
MITALKYFLFFIASFSVILSLVTCIYLLRTKQNQSLTLRLTMSPALMSWKQKLFLALVAVGYFICIYKGIESILWWIPDDWGGFNDENEWTSHKSGFAFAVSLCATFVTAEVVGRFNASYFLLDIYSIKSQELEKILQPYIGDYIINDNDGKKEFLRKLILEYEKILKNLEKANEDFYQSLNICYGEFQSFSGLKKEHLYKELIYFAKERVKSL